MPAQLQLAEFCASMAGIYLMPSDRNPDHRYTVTLSLRADPRCSCPSWAWSAPDSAPYDKSCKHLVRVARMMCGWNPCYPGGTGELQPDGYSDERFTGGSCPECSGPLLPVMIAV